MNAKLTSRRKFSSTLSRISENENKVNLFLKFALVSLLLVGAGIAINSNYGGDNDTYGMLYTFDSLINGNGYVPSRFTGYPVAEIGIGFIAFYFGSWLNNLTSLIFLVFSLLLIHRSLLKSEFDNKVIIFLLLCLSNPVLFFDNIAPMDYSWALLGFSLGLFFLSKENGILAVVFFGISVGARPNFIVFCLAAIFFLTVKTGNKISSRVSLAFASTLVGALFYVPMWFDNSLGLDWISAGQPLGQGYTGLFARFIYKTWMAVGLLILPIVIFLIGKNFVFFKKIKNFKLIGTLVLLNLIIYLAIPADRSYLQVALILLFLLLSQLSIKPLLLIFFLNLSLWFVNLQPFTFTMKYNDPCAKVEALGAKFDPHLEPGEFFIHFENQKKSECYVDYFKDKADRLNSGGRLR